MQAITPNVARLVRVPVYVGASAAAFSYLSDLVLAVAPLRLGEVQWRFGAIGTSANSIVAPVLMLLLAYVVAVAAGDRRVVAGLGVLAALVLVLVLAAIASFALDAIQMRARLAPGQANRFAAASGLAVLKLLLQAIVLLVVARGALRVFQGMRTVARPSSLGSESLVVGGMGKQT